MAEQTAASSAPEQGVQPQEGAQVPFEEQSFEEQMRALYAGETVESEDGGEEPEKKEPEAGEEKEAEPESETYTEEEFNQLDPFDVDPAKIPGAGAAVHKRYMQMYREQILPELEQLRAFKQKVLGDLQRAQARRDPRQEFANEVRERAMRALGVRELDELNQEHVIELSRQAAALQGEQQARSGEERERQVRAQQMNDLRAALREEVPEFEAVDLFAKSALNELPLAKAQRVIADLSSGDGARIRAVYKMFGEMYASAKKPAAPEVKQKEAPPVLIGGSGGEREKKSWDLHEFAGARSDDQARMLVEMGLVEDE